MAAPIPLVVTAATRQAMYAAIEDFLLFHCKQFLFMEDPDQNKAFVQSRRADIETAISNVLTYAINEDGLAADVFIQEHFLNDVQACCDTLMYGTTYPDFNHETDNWAQRFRLYDPATAAPLPKQVVVENLTGQILNLRDLPAWFQALSVYTVKTRDRCEIESISGTYRGYPPEYDGVPHDTLQWVIRNGVITNWTAVDPHFLDGTLDEEFPYEAAPDENPAVPVGVVWAESAVDPHEEPHEETDPNE